VYSYLQPLAVRPPEPLSILNQGLDSRLGNEVAIHLFAVPFEAAGARRGNELLISMPAMDLTLVVSLVLSLLALLLTCDTVIGERQDGTLRSIFANRISRRQFMAGKMAGGLMTICLPLAAALLASLAIVRFTVATPLTAAQQLRVAGLAVSYVAFLGLMLLIGLLISLSVRSSSQALGISVLVWFVLTIVVPGPLAAGASEIAAGGGARRTPEREIAALSAQFDRRMAEEWRRTPILAVFNANSASSFASSAHQAVRYRFGSAAYYDALANYYRFETQAGLRRAGEVFALRQRYARQSAADQSLEVALSILSPAHLLGRLGEAFSGTSVGEHGRFLAACRRYRLDVLAYLERQGALRGWRWFTDDPPDRLRPWPSYFGLSPEQVKPQEVNRLFSRLSEPALAAALTQDRAAIERDASRRLALDGLPSLSYAGPTFLGSLASGAAQGAALLLLDALAAAAVWARFRRYELG
jgi:hypothetical protein